MVIRYSINSTRDPSFYRFLDRNVSILTLAGFKHVRLLVTIFPEVLKVCSDALLDDQIHRNFLAISAKAGNIC